MNIKSFLTSPHFVTYRNMLLLLLIVFAIPLTVFFSQKNQDTRQRASEGKKQQQEVSKGYIIEFSDPSVIAHKNNTSRPDGSDSNAYEQGLKTKQQQTKQEIFTKLAASQTSRPESRGQITTEVLGEFTKTLNGIALNISKDQAESLKTIPNIKKIYPNLQVNATLQQSVPLIGADKLWERKDNQNAAITGKGSRIAIVDTGVDYSHPDLGATPFFERTFEKITQSPMANADYSDDQVFTIDNRNVYYPSGFSTIAVYNFDTKTTSSISIPGINNLSIKKLAVKGDYIAFIGQNINQEDTGLYVFQRSSGTLKHVYTPSTPPFIGAFSITDATKIVYDKGGEDTAYGIYIYDIATDSETLLDAVNISAPVVSGNKAAYATYLETEPCYNKIVLQDLSSGAREEVSLPETGPVIAMRGSEIVYVGCSKTNFDPTWSTYYLYNTETKNVQKISYPANPTTAQQSEKVTKKDSLLISTSWINNAAISDNLIFFQKDGNTSKAIAFEKQTGRYVQITLKKNSSTLASMGNTLCFSSTDNNIYCHNYDPAYAYPLPPQIFNSKVIDGYNFISHTKDPFDDNGHGTHVAATAAGNGMLKGVAPDAQIVAYKVLNAEGSGYFSDIIAALDMAAQTRLDTDTANDIDVLSMSLGADCQQAIALGGGSDSNPYNDYCGPDDPASTAVNNVVEAGIVVTIAAGNSGPGSQTIGSPGTAEKAITVGAVDKSKQIADFSSRGPVIWNGKNYLKPDIVAPGVAICAAEFEDYQIARRCIDDKHVAISGTSMATPHIAGVAALAKQYYASKNYASWSPLQIKTLILSTATSLGLGKDTEGSGLVNAIHIIPSPTPVLTTPTPQDLCTPCSANVDNDKKGIVTSKDLKAVTKCLNKPVTKKCVVMDINKDGKINSADLNCVTVQMNKVCPK